MNPTKLLQCLDDLCQDSSDAVIIKGYRWFQNTLTPTLKLATEQLNTETERLGESWLIAGEIHELLEAPLQALTCYQIATHFSPENPDIYHWSALVQEQLGTYIEAMANIDLAIKFSQNGAQLMEDRQRIQDCMVYDKAPDYQPNNLVWKYTELLAEGNFETIIQELKDSKAEDIEILRCLYRAYGINQQITDGENVWQQILQIDNSTEPDELDRFYWT